MIISCDEKRIIPANAVSLKMRNGIAHHGIFNLTD